MEPFSMRVESRRRKKREEKSSACRLQAADRRNNSTNLPITLPRFLCQHGLFARIARLPCQRRAPRRESCREKRIRAAASTPPHSTTTLRPLPYRPPRLRSLAGLDQAMSATLAAEAGLCPTRRPPLFSSLYMLFSPVLPRAPHAVPTESVHSLRGFLTPSPGGGGGLLDVWSSLKIV